MSAISSEKNQEKLRQFAPLLVEWYRRNKRDLPWRHHICAYHVWVSEIMLQQTRVEAVKPYYERFLHALPTVRDLAEVKEDQLLKLWEGLGYYNRVRNMQTAARQIEEEYDGEFPQTYEEILKLKGIGSYTAGAISSFAFGRAEPAVDGNVLRVLSRILGSAEDIMKASVKKEMEHLVREVIPKDDPADFNQGLIELGAIVCVPNGDARCESCPAKALCVANQDGRIDELPVKSKAKARRIEKKTILILKDRSRVQIEKRKGRGLLAGLYQLPNIQGHLNESEVARYCREQGYQALRIHRLPQAKHIFSHVEWQMIGYEIWLDELGKQNKPVNAMFLTPHEIRESYPIPSAFRAYMKYVLEETYEEQ